MITWITHEIAIGEFIDAMNPDLIKQEQIGTIFFLGEEDKNLRLLTTIRTIFREKGIHVYYKHVPVVVVECDMKCSICKHKVGCQFDSDGKFKTFNEKLNDEMKLRLNFAYLVLSNLLFVSYNDRVLVCCIAGIDRSPFIVARYLYKNLKEVYDNGKFYQIKTLSDAYAFIKMKRPFITEHYEWDW